MEQSRKVSLNPQAPLSLSAIDSSPLGQDFYNTEPDQ